MAAHMNAQLLMCNVLRLLMIQEVATFKRVNTRLVESEQLSRKHLIRIHERALACWRGLRERMMLGAHGFSSSSSELLGDVVQSALADHAFPLNDLLGPVVCALEDSVLNDSPTASIEVGGAPMLVVPFHAASAAIAAVSSSARRCVLGCANTSPLCVSRPTVLSPFLG